MGSKTVIPCFLECISAVFRPYLVTRTCFGAFFDVFPACFGGPAAGLEGFRSMFWKVPAAGLEGTSHRVLGDSSANVMFYYLSYFCCR